VKLAKAESQWLWLEIMAARKAAISWQWREKCSVNIEEASMA